MTDPTEIPSPATSKLISFESLKNLTALSAVIIAFSSLMAYFYILTYLTYFNASLIWIVEYSDLTKLIMFQFFSLFASILIAAYSYEPRLKKIQILSLIVAPAIIILTFITRYIRGNSGWQVVLSSVLIVTYIEIMSFLFVAYVRDFKNNGNKLKTERAIGLFALIVSSPIATGIIHAHSVEYDDRSVFDVDIDKDKYQRTLHEAKLIMAFSHHMIFKLGPTVVVLPTADISEMRSSPLKR